MMIAAVLILSPAYSAGIAFSYETPHYIKRAIEVQQSEFTEDALIHLARQFLAETKRVPIAVLYLAPNPSYLPYYMGKGSTDVDFGGWSARLRDSLATGWEPIPDLAEVDAIAGQAVLRIRRSGKVSRIVLTERDPLFIGKGKDRFEILEMQGMVVSRDAPPPSILRCRDCLKKLEVYVRGNSPFNRRVLVAAASEFGKLVRPANLSLHVRTDSWFVAFSSFPMLYAFDESFSLPQEATFAQTPRLAVDFDGRRGRVQIRE